MIFHIPFAIFFLQLAFVLGESNNLRPIQDGLTFPCGTLHANKTTRVDELDYIPWTATLHRRSENLIDRTWFGVIISENLILSSINTIIYSGKFRIYQTENYAVYTRQQYFEQTERDFSDSSKPKVQKIKITQIRPFPNYFIGYNNSDMKCAVNDYVLVHLQTPLVFDSDLHALCLPDADTTTHSGNDHTLDRSSTFFGGWHNVYKNFTVRTLTDLSETECAQIWKKTMPDSYGNRTCATLPDDEKLLSPRTCVDFGKGATVVKDIYNNGTYFFQGLTNCVNNYDCFKETTIFTPSLNKTLIDWINANERCGPNNFTCNNGDCIPLNQRCDKQFNCKDGSDEDSAYCRGLNYCDEINQFPCGTYGKCIDKNKRCNHVIDCENGEDEKNCDFSEDDDKITIITVTSCGAVTILLGSVILIVIRRKMKPIPDLTEKEVEEFLNGTELLFPLCTKDGEYVSENKFVDQFIDENSQKDDSEIFQNLWRQLKWDRTYEISKEFQLFINKDAILGSGQYGVVYRGLYSQRNDGPYSKCKNVAVKTLQDCKDVHHFKALLMELKVLAYIAKGKHENIVEFIAADTSEIKQRNLQLIMEFCPNGSLETYLMGNRNNFFPFINFPRSAQSENEAKMGTPEKTITMSHLVSWCFQIASAMEYLTSKRVIHGDLASRNVLLSHDLIAKVSDFGLSRKLYEYKSYKHNQKTLLPWRWLSIESLLYLEFSSQSDVWSFAVTAWEIFTLGETPYGEVDKAWDKHYTELCTGTSHLDKPHLATSEIYECMKNCWKLHPKDRPTFQELRIYFESLQTNINIRNLPVPSNDYVTILTMDV